MIDASDASRFEADRVAVAGGDGIIARRANAILYLPVADAALVEAFRRGADPLLAVTDHAADDGVACGPFAVVTWGHEVRVALYGPIELRSDHPALPALTGGSATWVERTIRPGRDVTFEIGQEADYSTDLVSGVVPAGGVHVALMSVARPGASAPSAPTPTPTAAEAPHDPDDVPHAQEAPSVARPDRAATGFELLRDPDDIVDADPEPAPAPSDPNAEVSPAPPEPEPAVDPDPGLPDIELPPVPPMPAHADVTQPPLESGWRRGSVTRAFRLTFTTGESFTVDRPLVLGRRPTLTPEQEGRGARAIPLDCSQVSASHLEVRPDGRELRLVDLGSRNGSFVVASGDQQLVRLEPNVGFPATAGTHVQVGTKLFEIVADAD